MPKAKTRKQKEKDEEYKLKDRTRKGNERKGWSKQKREAERKKARDRYWTKKAHAQSLEDKTNSDPNFQDDRSPKARVQAVTRLTHHLPKDPNHRQKTIDDFINKHQKIPQEDSNSVTATILSNTGMSSKEHLKLKQLLAKKMLHLPGNLNTAIKKSLKWRNSQVNSLSKSKASSNVKSPKKQFVNNSKKVLEFFKERARILPFKRTKQPTQVLERSLRILYREYLQGNSYIGFSTFCKYRPKNIKSQGFTKFNQALCETCENVDLKLKALNSVVRPPVAANKDGLLERVMCERHDEGRYFKPDCIHIKCQLCGPTDVWKLVKEGDFEKEVSLRQWEMKEVQRGDTMVKKKALVKKTATVKKVLGGLEEDLRTFPMHNFLAKWQYMQFNHKKKNPDQNEVVSVLDFAENYRCSIQDEAQSAHWNYMQATLHPIVCYYQCLHCDSCVTESIVIISNDLIHDSVAVKEFTKVACVNLKRKLPNLQLMTQFTDGCSSQYKSKKPFTDIQNSKDIFGMDIERHFFGSRHGKNPSDGESAVVKNSATRAVKTRQAIIQNAADLHEYCVQNLTRGGSSEECVHFQRVFFFVDSSTIQEQRRKDDQLGSDTKALVGTRSIHSIKPEQGGGVAYRNVTCFCSEDLCENAEYVDRWKRHTMTQSNQKQKQKQKQKRKQKRKQKKAST